MMERTVVWKYRLPKPDAKTGRFAVGGLPGDAEVLSLGVQHHELVLWARHRTGGFHSDMPGPDRYFALVNTGMDVPIHRDETFRFIGTATVPVAGEGGHLYPGGIVWHLFEILDEPF